ncbi:PREDICTED: nodal modulator 1 [Nicrophorus vespilloides]|uniref:Nodal modulator 1 n=1 Tax=Nicrophorus vespilloides TaxID=110193 RepID=A0ABM1MVQ1_NICVS|nr:PREDICTED: nodal modulator 1 [Nicrophorus vespilloides]
MKMNKKLLFLSVFLNAFLYTRADDVLGCGGFIKSHVPIDFSKVLVKLYTKQGILKDQTNCAPNNGYYFIPLYDKGDYILQLQPPPGWSFTPTKVVLQVNGKDDLCSEGKDINFSFKGFGIAGKVESAGSDDGPIGVNVELKSNNEIRKTVTTDKGVFFFTPVYPGTYEITISHPKWKFVKDILPVTVTEGNTELPQKSLIVAGYDLTGSIKSEDVPIVGAHIALYADPDNQNPSVRGCDKSDLKVFKAKGFLCHAVSDTNGNYLFPSLSNGKYYVVPFYKGQSVHFEPNKIEFTISHDGVTLKKSFEIAGFSVTGRVLNAPNGAPLEGAEIMINGKSIGTTSSSGTYNLEKIKAGTYTIQVVASDYKFESQSMKVSPSVNELPNIYPQSYKVCGKVISDKMESVQVSITRIGSTQHIALQTDYNTGKFCQHLTPGKYQVQVNVPQSQTLQFFPITQLIEVISSPVNDITFSQLKATITGDVDCQKSRPDCAGLKVIFKATIDSEQYIANVIDNKYVLNDMRPGTYKVSLSSNNLCWKEKEFIITITSTTHKVPTFVQNGYSITFVTSHDTKVTYKVPGQDGKVEALPLAKGNSKHCVQKAGVYKFNLDSCHTYSSNVITYDTNQKVNEIIIDAETHKNVLAISANEDFGNIFVSISIEGVKKMHGPIKFGNQKYLIEIFLSAGETAIIVPQSEELYFNPPILSIKGDGDCADLGVKFEAKRGKVFKGRINPPLQGVQITVESENTDLLLDESNSEGYYKFPPLDDSKPYKVQAKKDFYVLIGPDANGDFLAHKLAEVVVEILDETDGLPLQGALLSLSGGESYRSNMQTDENGKIKFPSLSPSEYFLKPMMKEYSFNPPSKIIKVEVGASVKVQLKGKRVAYSAYGFVTSLNNQPEERMIVVADGNHNCSQYSEEATSESNGYFRIRGLIPYCSYEIKVKGGVDEKDTIERSTPASYEVASITSDITDVHMVVFRTSPNTDIMVKVHTANPEHYKNLRVKLARESSPAGLVHSVKVDTNNYKITKDYNPGIMIQIPSVPYDGKSYSLQLESSTPALNKGNAQIKFFAADSSLKFIQLDFIMKSSQTDQHIKQTSIWTLAFIFGMMIAAYNIDKIVQLVKFKIPVNNVENLWKPKTVTPEYVPVEEIDQIVENINSVKRKVKSKRI